MIFKKQEPRKNERLSREDRFKKIASKRVDDILRKFQLLKNCSNKANYSYTDEQVRKIFSAVDSEWKSVKDAFNQNKQKKKGFSL
jgi:hypothetical protein